jgi:hypothetical protein
VLFHDRVDLLAVDLRILFNILGREIEYNTFKIPHNLIQKPNNKPIFHPLRKISRKLTDPNQCEMDISIVFGLSLAQNDKQVFCEFGVRKHVVEGD